MELIKNHTISCLMEGSLCSAYHHWLARHLQHRCPSGIATGTSETFMYFCGESDHLIKERSLLLLSGLGS